MRWREKKQIRFIEGDAKKEPHIAYKDGIFGTASGRFEFYREMPMVRALSSKTPTPEEVERDRMARWFPPLEAWPENDLYKKYPLVLMSERPCYRVHSQRYSTPLLRELDSEPFVRINPADAGRARYRWRRRLRGMLQRPRNGGCQGGLLRRHSSRHAGLSQGMAALPAQGGRLV